MRRQNGFVVHCMQRFKSNLNKRAPWRENLTELFIPEWVLMRTDSDEFLVYNYIHADQEDENNYELFRGKTTQDVDMLRLRMIPKRKRLPALQRHVTVADWLSVENEI